MEKAISWLVVVAIMVLGGTTLARDFASALDSNTRSLAEVHDRDDNALKTRLSTVSTMLLPGRQNIDVTLRNSGRTKLAEFASWDVIIQYYDADNAYHSTWLPYTTSTPGDNQWTVQGIYVDAASLTAENLDPGVLNPTEEVVIRARVSPAASPTAVNLAVVTASNGFTTWSYFQLHAYYLHNNPSPPTGNTAAQANLSMDATQPSAGTLYNYDSGYDSSAGRFIRKSSALASETDLHRYQNWQSVPMRRSLEFDSLGAEHPTMVQVASDTFAIAYQGDGGYGYLKTVRISSEANISSPVIDSIQFDTSLGAEPDIIHAAGDIYAIAYRGPSDIGYVKTVSILSNGTINHTIVDTLQFDPAKALEPDLVQVGDGYFAIFYTGNSNKGSIKTVQISADGLIADAVVDTSDFEATKCLGLVVFPVSGSIYAVAYQGGGNAVYVKTVQISSAGVITDTPVDALTIDTGSEHPDLLQVAGEVFALAYADNLGKGILKTVQVSASGMIADSPIDSLVFDSSSADRIRLGRINAAIYAAAYTGDDDRGYLKTVEILSNGMIADTVAASSSFDGLEGREPDVIHVYGDFYAVAYQGPGDDGWLKTFEIQSNGTIGRAIIINGNVALSFWSAIQDFELERRGVVVAYLRDYSGTGYTEIANAILDVADWQGGSTTWVEKSITFSGVTYTVPAGHYLEVKLLVANSSQDMWFAYDAGGYLSRLEVPWLQP